MTSSVKEISVQEFSDSGLLWFINMQLHAFGHVLVRDVDSDGKEFIYPAKATFRGFPKESNDNGYKKLEKFMDDFSSEENKKEFE